MRKLALLIASTVLFLAFKPGLDHLLFRCEKEVSCCVESCEPFANDKERSKSENDRDCNGNSCNPFQSCGASFVLTFDSYDTSFQNLEVTTDRNFNYQFNIHSQFLSDFWQPPQIVYS